MDFSTIKEIDNGDLKIIQQLKKSNKKIYVYGCAAHAEMICKYLINNGLTVEGYFVDHCFYKENFYISGLKVNDIDEYIENLDDYNIVIGFCEISKSKFLLQNQKILKGSYFLIWEHDVGYVWDEKYLTEHNEMLSGIYDELSDEKSRSILKELAYSKVNHVGGRLLELADNNEYFNELTFEIDPTNEIYVDCGAFNGDTILKYIAFTNNKYKKIYAFEPNENNCGQLKENTKEFQNIEIIPKGLWNEEKILKFDFNGSNSSVSEEGENTVAVTMIDNIVGNDKVTFIKMDIEGSELEALKGAKNTIRRNMPKLAICCYHKSDDLINLYSYIKSFNTDDLFYKFYLRHHSNSAYETVLYGIPVKKN